MKTLLLLPALLLLACLGGNVQAQVWTTYTTADGLPSNTITALSVSRDSHYVWAGTPAGLARLNAETWTAYTTADGLPSDRVTALAEHKVSIGFDSEQEIVIVGTSDGIGAYYQNHAGQLEPHYINSNVPGNSAISIEPESYFNGDELILDLWIANKQGLHYASWWPWNSYGSGPVADVAHGLEGQVWVARTGVGIEEWVWEAGGLVRDTVYARETVDLCLENATALDVDVEGVLRVVYFDYGLDGNGRPLCSPPAPGVVASGAALPERLLAGNGKMGRYDGSTWRVGGPGLPPGDRAPSAGDQLGSSLTDVVALPNGAVWISATTDGGPGGVAYTLNEASDEWVVLNTGNSALPSDDVYALELDPRGGFWLATAGGVAHYTPPVIAPDLDIPINEATNVPLRPVLSWDVALAATTYDIEVAQDADFNELVASATGIEATSYAVVDPLDARATYFWRVRSRQNDTISDWSPPHRFTTGHRDWTLHPMRQVFTVEVEEASGAVWIGEGEGDFSINHLQRLDPVSATWENMGCSTGGPPTKIAADDEGGVWIGYDGYYPEFDLPEPGRLSRIDSDDLTCEVILPCDQPFCPDLQRVNAIASSEGHTWAIITWQDDLWDTVELVRLAPSFSNQHELNLPTGIDATALAPESNGSIWVGHANGLHYGTPPFTSNDWTEHTGNLGLPAINIRALRLDEEGLWVATSGGLARRIGSTWTTYLEGTNLLDLEVRGGEVWARTQAGLMRGVAPYTPADWSSYTYGSTLPEEAVRNMRFDAEGNLWAGTAGGGATLYNDGEWTFYSRSNAALLSDVVTAIATHESGAVWIGTSKGVVETRASGASGVGELTASPGTLDFGAVDLGQTSVPQAVTLSNTGGADLTVTALSLTGPDAAQFSITDAPAVPFTLAPGAAEAVEVAFAPASIGAFSAGLLAQSDAGDATVALSGTGTGVLGCPGDAVVQPWAGASGGPGAAFAVRAEGLAFVENRGQWPDDVLFQARLGGATAWVTRDGITFDFYEAATEPEAEYDDDAGPAEPVPATREATARRPEDERARRTAGRAAPQAASRRDHTDARRSERRRTAASDVPDETRQGHVVAMRFEGGRARRATGQGQLAAYHNYLLGADPARWASHVPLYDEIVLEGLYPGVDLRLYEDAGRLRYDLVLAPGADAAQVRMRMEGAGSIAVTEAGALALTTALGTVEHRGPAAQAFSVTADGTASLRVREEAPAEPLVLSATLWSTFLGGSGGDYARAVAVGEDGAVTVVGGTAGTGFPTTTGAYDMAHNGGTDAFVARLAADGASLVYATFLGGSADDDARGVAVGPDGRVTVAGDTGSSDFPTTAGAYDPSYNGGADAFVARLAADGASLVYGTFLGGAEGDDHAHAVALAPDGSAVVVGDTRSAYFPTTAGAFDRTFNGVFPTFHPDAFAARLSPDGSALLYGTFFGGTERDFAYGVGVGADGAATLAGSTRSADFPTTAGAFDTSHNGQSDAFVARLTPGGGALAYSTFLGGSDYDHAQAVALSADGAATVAGSTFGAGFPTTTGAYDPSHNGGNDAFVARLAPDGASLAYGTFLGGTGADLALGVAVAQDGSATVTGRTDGAGLPTTPDAADPSHNGLWDAFASRLSPDGSALLYGTFLGGTGYDRAYAVALGPDGAATLVGETNGASFPTSPGACDPSFNGGTDAFVVRLDVGPPAPGCPLAFNGASITPLTVAPGGAFNVTVNVSNAGPGPRPARLRLRYVRAGGGLTGLITLGTGTVPVTSGVVARVSQRVPGNAPGGSYGLELELVDVQTDAVCDTRPFTLSVQAAQTVTAARRATDARTDAHRARASRNPVSGQSAAAHRVTPADVVGDVDFVGAEVENLFGEAVSRAVTPEKPSPGEEAPAAAVTASGAMLAPGEVAVWPNPAGSRVAVAFALADGAEVRLALYDVLGRQVAEVEAGRLAAGQHRLGLDLAALPAGVYVYRLAVGDVLQTGRLTVAR